MKKKKKKKKKEVMNSCTHVLMYSCTGSEKEGGGVNGAGGG